MPRPFYQATAEQVVLVTEAVISLGGGDKAKIGSFTDLPEENAENALLLAVDLGLLAQSGADFSALSPLCRVLRTPQDREKAAVLRVLLEAYEPFLVFREEHEATESVTDAAQRTKVKLDLDCHREKVKETLLNLATYSGAMNAGQGNTYERDARGLTALLDELAAGSREEAEATLTVRNELGTAADQVDNLQVIQPLAAGLRHAAAGSGREAVLQAGIAVENYLTSVADLLGVNVASSNGVNAKMQALVTPGHFPKKLNMISKYVGHLRNAADHGVDPEIGVPWNISGETGRNYVFVCCALIQAMVNHRSGVQQL